LKILDTVSIVIRIAYGEAGDSISSEGDFTTGIFICSTEIVHTFRFEGPWKLMKAGEILQLKLDETRSDGADSPSLGVWYKDTQIGYVDDALLKKLHLVSDIQQGTVYWAEIDEITGGTMWNGYGCKIKLFEGKRERQPPTV
jgi:hypothetical protein